LKQGIFNCERLIVRKACLNDAEAIAGTVNQVASEEVHFLWDKINYDVELERRYIESANTKENSVILVAELDGKIIGTCELKKGEFKKNRHTAELGITLLKEFRRLGAGSALMEGVINWAKEKKIEKICLSVFSTNEAAIALYRKFGFEVEAARKKQFKTEKSYVDEIFMARFLDH
jgi:RimJ/RimL family protein N-acetyltransferase